MLGFGVEELGSELTSDACYGLCVRPLLPLVFMLNFSVESAERFKILNDHGVQRDRFHAVVGVLTLVRPIRVLEIGIAVSICAASP